MQILMGFSILALIATIGTLIASIHIHGVAETERFIARWLLVDARGWDERANEKTRSREELAALQ